MIKRYLLAASLCLTVPFLAPSGISASTVNAENTVNDMIVGPVEQEDADITIDESTETGNAVEEETTKEDNRYADLAFSIANNYVNIRKKPNLESKVVGKLYKGSAATVISEKNGWIKVESGTVTGYISKEFLAIGEDAEKLLDEYATKTATVTTETLKVREKPNTDSDCLTLVGEGDTYTVTKESKNWVKIKINSSETSTRKGYLSKDFTDVSYKYEYAVSIEEELARIAAEEAAKKAEEARQAEEAARQAQSAASTSSYSGSSSSNSSSSNSSSSPQGSSSSSSSSSASAGSSSSSTTVSASAGTTSGSRIASYATQFVGNPYVWGGTSLTNGADCSGFTQAVFRNFGYSIPRTSSSQSSAGKSVSVSNLQAGDLIFYGNGGTVNHVALYIGGGRVVHASNAKDGIKISQYNYRSIYSIRRIV